MADTNGLVRVVNPGELDRLERVAAQARREAQDAVDKARDSTLTGLAGYIMPLWEDAKRAKLEVRPRLLECLRQRRGEYSEQKLAKIRETGGSEIFMMITSVKCRAAASWLRDALLGKGNGKPWTISPTPSPSLPSDAEAQLLRSVGQEVGAMAAMGVEVPPDVVRERIDAAREALKAKIREKARLKAEDSERVLEDQLIEGGYEHAMDEFLDDFVTYPAAILKGPVVHRSPVLRWEKQPAQGPGVPDRWIPIVEDQLVKRWYRVDPFKFFPAAWAANVEDGPCFEHHRITKDELFRLIGAPGYDEKTIREIISDEGSYSHWLGLDWYDSADNINQPRQLLTSDGPMDALEFYGPVPGKHLIEWGVDDPEVTDPEKSYNVNLWMIGNKVFKASINPDPLGKKPYRKGCYEEIPGAFWGNGIPDLIRDVQDMCNAAARSLNNNMGLSSGPQVAINVSRMPPGAKITQIYPWKIHQFEEPPLGSTSKPMEFFQPQSNADALIGVFTFFSGLADEYSGLPRYMAGDGNVGGAGRTASGLASLMSNANRLMKQVMAAVDRINTDVLETLHSYLMQFEFDRFPELEGDIRIVAKGAASVMAREQLALRRSEFLAATVNPIDSQLMGPAGRGYLLKEQAKGLELDSDRIVPGAAAAQQQTMAPPGPQGPGVPGTPGAGALPGQPGQPGSPPNNAPGQRPVGATMDRIPGMAPG